VLRPGSVFAHYELEAVAGSGGMGVVYRARDLRLGRPVALKIIAPHLARQPLVRERLNREAMAAAAVDHPNVVALYEAGEHDDTVYIATRWIDGTTLSQLVEREGGLEFGRAARLLVQVAGALQGAHGAGLVHRDVTPSNVIVDARDHAYLTDFGLTRRATDVTGLTGTGQLLATLDYVAPEQIEGGAVDLRADIYSLGCLGWFLLCGEAPFPRDGHAAKLYAHLSAEYAPVGERRPDVPAQLDDALRRAMAKDPAARQPSAAAFAEEVAAATGSLAAAVTTAAAAAPAPALGAESNGAQADVLVDVDRYATPPSRAARRRRGPQRAVGALSVALLLGAPGALYAGLHDHRAGAQRVTVGSAAASVTADGRRVVVAGGASGTVTSVPDGSAPAARRVIDLGGWVRHAQDAGGHLYVTGGRRLTIFDDRRPGTGRRVMLPGTAGSLTAERGVAWIALADAPALVHVAGGTTRTVALPHAAADVQVARRTLWVADAAAGTVQRRDARSGLPLGPPVHVGRRPVALAVTRDAVWVVDAGRQALVRLDPRAGRRAGAPIPVAARPVAVAADERQVWVVSAGRNKVTRIDARSGRPVDEIGVPRGPSSIALTPSAAWVTSARGWLTRLPRA
jgi:hypothetical protein